MAITGERNFGKIDKPKKEKIKYSALEIKHALLSYYRFTRQCICASECMDNDVMVLTKKDIIEIEVKISKADLWKGEAKKIKHKKYANPTDGYWKSTQYRIPNRFYICIPEYLGSEAEKWVEAVNSNYGIIVCHKYSYNFYPLRVTIYRGAKKLHNNFDEATKKSIMMRVCSENIGLIAKILRSK